MKILVVLYSRGSFEAWGSLIFSSGGSNLDPTKTPVTSQQVPDSEKYLCGLKPGRWGIIMCSKVKITSPFAKIFECHSVAVPQKIPPASYVHELTVPAYPSLTDSLMTLDRSHPHSRARKSGTWTAGRPRRFATGGLAAARLWNRQCWWAAAARSIGSEKHPIRRRMPSI
jgi:hypothetical protein